VSEDKGQENYEAVLTTLRDNAEDVLRHVAHGIIYLGSKVEWSMDDNFATTEGIAGLSDRFGIPAAHDQNDSELNFYRSAATHLGYAIEDDDEDES
jgi:hypothetical protein